MPVTRSSVPSKHSPSCLPAGILTAVGQGRTDFSSVQTVLWLILPSFTAPEWNINAVLLNLMLPEEDT